MIAVGSYLATLRSGLGLTQLDAANEVGVDIKTIQNWEKGKKVPYSHLLAAFVKFVRADPWVVNELLLDEQADAESGRKLALVQLKDPLQEVVEEIKERGIDLSQPNIILDHFLDLVSSGMNPQDAAKIVRTEKTE